MNHRVFRLLGRHFQVALVRTRVCLFGKNCVPLTPVSLPTPVQDPPRWHGSISGGPTAKGSENGGAVTGCRHRERILSMRLDHLNLAGKLKLNGLRAEGIVTAGDLALCSAAKLDAMAEKRPRFRRWLCQRQRAIRLAASIDGLMPVDAVALVMVHRCSVTSLARQNASQLHRDLERFSGTRVGARLMRRRRPVSLRRIRQWVSAARDVTGGTGEHVRIRPRPAPGMPEMGLNLVGGC